MLRFFLSCLLPAALFAGCASVPPPTASSSPDAPAGAAAPPANASASSGEGSRPLDAAAAAAATAASQSASTDAVATAAAAAPVPVDPLRPDVRLDLADRATRVDLWQRVRNGFAVADLDSALVREQERWYASRPDYVARMTERGGRYLFHIVEELDKRGMPTELALLPFIESAFNPQAMSVARASGMWQFIPSTGRDFELKQNVFRDDRRDVLASTRAALDYLQRLYAMFGDWHLALAAYNWGEGNVQRAIARNQRAGLAADYSSLRMPAETQNYVPKLQAVKNIVARPQAFGLTLPELLNHPYFLSVPIERDIDVEIAVRLSGLGIDDFLNLNPQMNRPVILAAGTSQILLPYDNANRFVRELPRHRGPLASWTAWVAPRTMRPAEAAQAAGMTEEQLREVNRIPPRMLVKAGSTLLVPRHNALLADVSSTIADNGTMTLAPDAPPPRRIALKAGRHDTVDSVARRMRVSPALVAQWNGVSRSARFAPGQSIVVFVAAGKARRGAVATAAASDAEAASAAPSRATSARASRTKAAGARTATAHAPADRGATSHVARSERSDRGGGRTASSVRPTGRPSAAGRLAGGGRPRSDRGAVPSSARASSSARSPGA